MNVSHISYGVRMEISKGIEIIGTGLFIRDEKLLVINDLHIGYEEALQQKGILVPRFQTKEIIRLLTEMIERVKPVMVLLNGDVKHEFGRVLRGEWREVLEVIDFLQKLKMEIIIVRGNHDPILQPIVGLRGVRMVTEYRIGETLIVHGDELVEKERLKDVKRIIIGHEHPAIMIREGGKKEKYKCFLKGKWNRGGLRKGLEIIAVPSFNPLLEGTDVLKEEVLSPFLEKISEFEVFVVSRGEVFNFGKVKDVGK